MTRCYCPTCRPIGYRKTYTEEWRHECEVRMLSTFPQARRRAYIVGTKESKGVIHVRGENAAVELIKGLMKLGCWEGD